ncbi:hypothetical protein R3P38DRAFT_2768096 [Favolaschia claudopus]|uniref:C2H2-type domain-containing protein n=1 Tax=Favolaschia claudopus TaxID=2862362 RepID=A0AAW0CRI2_9AGAR
MPRVPSASSFPARVSNSSVNGRTPPNPPLQFRCPHDGCRWSYNNKTDLTRHTPLHLSLEEREKLMILCTFPGCTHKCLQRSNMRTHYTTKHTTDKPHACPKCPYSTGDPACLTRHKRRCAAGGRVKNAPRKNKAASGELQVVLDFHSLLSMDTESLANGSDSGSSSASSSASASSSFPYSPSPSTPPAYEAYSPDFVPAPLGLGPSPDLDYSLLAPSTGAGNCLWNPCAFPIPPASTGLTQGPAMGNDILAGGSSPSLYLAPSWFDPASQYVSHLPQYEQHNLDPFNSFPLMDPFLFSLFESEFIYTA